MTGVGGDNVRGRATKVCPGCGSPFGRKRYASGRLEKASDFRKRVYCSKVCYLRAEAKQLHGIPDEKTCEVCGAPFGRKRWANGVLEQAFHYRKRRTCSPACGQVLAGRLGAILGGRVNTEDLDRHDGPITHDGTLCGTEGEGNGTTIP